MEFVGTFLKKEEAGVSFNPHLFFISLSVLVFSDQKEMHLALVKRQIVKVRMFPRELSSKKVNENHLPGGCRNAMAFYLESSVSSQGRAGIFRPGCQGKLESMNSEAGGRVKEAINTFPTNSKNHLGGSCWS